MLFPLKINYPFENAIVPSVTCSSTFKRNIIQKVFKTISKIGLNFFHFTPTGFRAKRHETAFVLLEMKINYQFTNVSEGQILSET